MLDVVITIHRENKQINDALHSLEVQVILPSRVIIIFNKDPCSIEFIKIPKKIQVITSIFFYNEKRNGNYARNCGLKHCKSNLVAFLDCDDTWEKNRTSFIINSKMNNEWDILFNDFYSGSLNGRKKIINVNAYNLNSFNSLGGFSSVVFTQKALKLIGDFDEELESCQDWDVWVRASILLINLHCINYPLSLHRVGSLNSITFNNSAQYRGLRKLYFKHKNYFTRSVFIELLIRRLLNNSSFVNQLFNIKLIGLNRYLRFIIKKNLKYFETKQKY